MPDYILKHAHGKVKNIPSSSSFHLWAVVFSDGKNWKLTVMETEGNLDVLHRKGRATISDVLSLPTARSSSVYSTPYSTSFPSTLAKDNSEPKSEEHRLPWLLARVLNKQGTTIPEYKDGLLGSNEVVGKWKLELAKD